MSQLQQDITDDATLDRGLRPEEDPWSALAVAQDDVLADNGIPSPVVGQSGAGAADDDVDDDDELGDEDGGIPSPDVAVASADVAIPSPDVAAPAAPVNRFARAAADDWDDDADDAGPRDDQAVPQAELEADDEPDETVVTMLDPAFEPTRGGAFTIPMLCAGITIIACCLLIPQADANRRLAYERLKLQADLEVVERQVAVNEEFLNRVSDDPNLAERLAQRQMKIIRAGTKVLDLKGDQGESEMSPFQLTAVPPPPKLPPYVSRGGKLAELCYNPKSRLYLIGVGLLLTAIGLVLGFGPRSAD